MASRGDANRLYAETFDHMKFYLTPKATYLLTRRIDSGNCNLEVFVTLAASSDAPIWIKEVEIRQSNYDDRTLKISPMLRRVLVAQVNQRVAG